MVPTFTWGFVRSNFALAIVDAGSGLVPTLQTALIAAVQARDRD
jgi:hypothetical protein